MRKGRKREEEWEREGEGKKERRGNQGRKREGSTISLSLYLHLQQDGIAARPGSPPAHTPLVTLPLPPLLSLPSLTSPIPLYSPMQGEHSLPLLPRFLVQELIPL